MPEHPANERPGPLKKQGRDGEVVEQKDLPLVHAIDGDSWRAVAELSTRECWQRLWVWQEAIAARREPVVVCGGHILAWEDVRLATHARTILAGASGRGLALRPGMTTRNFPYHMAFWRDRYLEWGTDRMRQKFGSFVLSGNRNTYVC